MSTSVSIVLDTRRAKSNKKYPVKLRVTQERISEYYSTVFDLTQEEYNKFSAPRISDSLQEVREHIRSIELDARKALDKIIPFDFRIFENNYINNCRFFKPKKKRKDKQSSIATNSEEFDFRHC